MENTIKLILPCFASTSPPLKNHGTHHHHMVHSIPYIPSHTYTTPIPHITYHSSPPLLLPNMDTDRRRVRHRQWTWGTTRWESLIQLHLLLPPLTPSPWPALRCRTVTV
jgi:hypothetical protein